MKKEGVLLIIFVLVCFTSVSAKLGVPSYKFNEDCSSITFNNDGRVKVTMYSSEASLSSSVYMSSPEEVLIVADNLFDVGSVTEKEYPANIPIEFFIRTDATSWGLGIYDHYSTNGNFCKMKSLGKDSWLMGFEDLPAEEADFDYDDVVILIELFKPEGDCFPEICDGLDNDCDGAIDNDVEKLCGTSGLGVCSFGTQTCTNGLWGPCSGGSGASEEICDGLDNDCDGETDEGMYEYCGTDAGECQTGLIQCIDGSFTECEGAIGPEFESCDGKDNDCNGIVDDGVLCECTPGEQILDLDDIAKRELLLVKSEDNKVEESEFYVFNGAEWTKVGMLGSDGLSFKNSDTAIADFNGDGKQELLVKQKQPTTSEISRFYQLNEGIWELIDESKQDGLSMTGEKEVSACDITGDSIPELIVKREGYLKKTWIYNWKSASKKWELLKETPTELFILKNGNTACGDYDGDNVNELIVKNENKDEFYAFSFNGESWVKEGHFESDNLVHHREEIAMGSLPIQIDVSEFSEQGTNICGTDTGECSTGTRECISGIWGDCSGEISPNEEICNSLDDDCDGEIDEGVLKSCGSSVGACSSGVQMCDNGVFTECEGATFESAEICDGIDNDCDGEIDEEISVSCGSDVGTCSPGTSFCVGGVLGECIGETKSSEEICDGLDNDCDGAIDDGIACTCKSGTTKDCGSDIGECSIGTQTCINEEWSKCAGRVESTTEICDGLDNDCDGEIDEYLKTLCGSDIGECVKGVKSCVNGAWTECTGSLAPIYEICDNIDNDCDGEIDEDMVCTEGHDSAELIVRSKGTGVESAEEDQEARQAGKECGNGICEYHENCRNCPTDCGECPSRGDLSLALQIYEYPSSIDLTETFEISVIVKNTGTKKIEDIKLDSSIANAWYIQTGLDIGDLEVGAEKMSTISVVPLFCTRDSKSVEDYRLDKDIIVKFKAYTTSQWDNKGVSIRINDNPIEVDVGEISENSMTACVIVNNVHNHDREKLEVELDLTRGKMEEIVDFWPVGAPEGKVRVYTKDYWLGNKKPGMYLLRGKVYQKGIIFNYNYELDRDEKTVDLRELPENKGLEDWILYITGG